MVDQSKRHSRNEEDQKDFFQEACCMIGVADPLLDLDSYKNIALNAIRSLYRFNKKRREYCITEEEMCLLKYRAWQHGYIAKY